MLHPLTPRKLLVVALAALAHSSFAAVIEPIITDGFAPPTGYKVILPTVTSATADPVIPRVVLAPASRQPQAKPKSSAQVAPELLVQIVKGAKLHAIDPYLVKAVIKQESNFNPRAVSPKNAIGLMQVLPGTARGLGLRAVDKTSVEELLHDPWISILVGARYLSEQIARFGRIDLALAAYNAGPAAVEKAGNRIPKYRETQDYVQRVMQNYLDDKRQATLAGAGA